MHVRCRKFGPLVSAKKVATKREVLHLLQGGGNDKESSSSSSPECRFLRPLVSRLIVAGELIKEPF